MRLRTILCLGMVASWLVGCFSADDTASGEDHLDSSGTARACGVRASYVDAPIAADRASVPDVVLAHSPAGFVNEYFTFEVPRVGKVWILQATRIEESPVPIVKFFDGPGAEIITKIRTGAWTLPDHSPAQCEAGSTTRPCEVRAAFSSRPVPADKTTVPDDVLARSPAGFKNLYFTLEVPSVGKVWVMESTRAEETKIPLVQFFDAAGAELVTKIRTGAWTLPNEQPVSCSR